MASSMVRSFPLVVGWAVVAMVAFWALPMNVIGVHRRDVSDDNSFCMSAMENLQKMKFRSRPPMTV